MIEEDVIKKLRERYKNLHPLIFHRSAERAESAVDLFDILEGFPDKMPVAWDEERHCWETTSLDQGASFKAE